MDRRIETRVVDTGGNATTTLIQKNACKVWWLDISPQTAGQAGILKLYDGFDDGGKLRFQAEIGYARMANFIPPIPCDQGIYVTVDAKVASYTIAYAPTKWAKE